jgi:hypothetical protein
VYPKLTDVKPTVGPGQPRIANVGSADPAEGGRPRSTDINPRQQTGSIKARNAVKDLNDVQGLSLAWKSGPKPQGTLVSEISIKNLSSRGGQH